MLGQLGDARALEALLEILPEYRTRYLVVIALGMIGDARAFDTLEDLLGYEEHTTSGRTPSRRWLDRRSGPSPCSCAMFRTSR